MLLFVSEEEYQRHIEYQRKEALMLSVEEKKYPEYSSRSIYELLKLSRQRREASTLCALRASIKLHDIYFSSFKELKYARSDAVRVYFGSESALLSTLYKLGMENKYGFVGIALGRGGTPFLFSVGYISGSRDARGFFNHRDRGITRAYRSADYAELFGYGDPILSIDLCEHAYFDGYSFDKERYLTASLAHLRIEAVDENISLHASANK